VLTTPALDRALLLARTVRHLRASQVVNRARLRGQRGALARVGPPISGCLRRSAPEDARWPDNFVALDRRLGEAWPSAEANGEGRFRFLEVERTVVPVAREPADGACCDWEQADASQLWRYHLHYFEWGWAFTSCDDRDWASDAFLRLWRSWREGTRFGRWDAWSPYVASLRAWSLCGLFDHLVAGTDEASAYRADLGLHAGFVRAHLESDVGGNHLLKNLKALIGLGVFLHDGALVRLGSRRLERELALQVLADGGHYERSPSYHCQVLGDLLDVEGLLKAAGAPSVPALAGAIDAMRRWLGAMLLPDGNVPLFNDCVLVGLDRIAALEPTPRPVERLTVLQPSGYVVACPGPRIHLVADVGPPCPPELPAHAHADCLSFELCVDGKRVVVNSGTSTYAPGARRQWERSTAAHNTVEVDGADQTEVWGAFRAGRRAGAELEVARIDGDQVTVSASHDGYQRLRGRPRHRRTWHAGPAGIVVVDHISGAGHHAVAARLHLSSAVHHSGDQLIGGLVRITATVPLTDEPDARGRWRATNFGDLQPVVTIVAQAEGLLPISLVVNVLAAPVDDPHVAHEPGAPVARSVESGQS